MQRPSEEIIQMAFKILLKRFKAFKVRRVGVKAIKNTVETRRIWTGISHGFHMVDKDGKVDGSVHAQREQVESLEFWLFGAYDQQMANGIPEYLQSHLFDNHLSEYQIRRKAKEMMKKAYLSAKMKLQNGQKADNIFGASSMVVMNGERFVAAAIGGYRAVLCRDGVAIQLGTKRQRKSKRKWSVSDMWNSKCTSINSEDDLRKSSRLMITAQKVEAETEFVILASDGIWEVMRNQEAVDLVAHIEDAQKAAECLAEEAINRMSKSSISCILIRFH